ncbi:MAG TPA: hypothetical protein VMY41_14290 [Thermohalobaculum sp.]|nr:hypothetical protein [Thermohalobaculum sp.]
MIKRCLKIFLAAAVLALVLPADPSVAQVRPKGCLIEIWPDFLGPGPQEHKVRETLRTDAGEIFAIEFGPLVGEYAKVYMFFLVYDDCERKVLLVGSFNYQTELARERGEIGPDQRRYHLDLFDPEEHHTIEFRTQVPRYEEMREMALNLLR